MKTEGGLARGLVYQLTKGYKNKVRGPAAVKHVGESNVAKMIGVSTPDVAAAVPSSRRKPNVWIAKLAYQFRQLRRDVKKLQGAISALALRVASVQSNSSGLSSSGPTVRQTATDSKETGYKPFVFRSPGDIGSSSTTPKPVSAGSVKSDQKKKKSASSAGRSKSKIGKVTLHSVLSAVNRLANKMEEADPLQVVKVESSQTEGTVSTRPTNAQIGAVIDQFKVNNHLLGGIAETISVHAGVANEAITWIEKSLDIRKVEIEKVEARLDQLFAERGSFPIANTPDLREKILDLITECWLDYEDMARESGTPIPDLAKINLEEIARQSQPEAGKTGAALDSAEKHNLELLIRELNRITTELQRVNPKRSVGLIEGFVKTTLSSVGLGGGAASLFGGLTTTVQTGGFLGFFTTTVTVANPAGIAAAGLVGSAVAAASIYGLTRGLPVPNFVKRFARAKAEVGAINPWASLRLGTPNILGTGAAVGLSIREPKDFSKEMFWAWDGNVVSLATFADDLISTWLGYDKDIRSLDAQRERAQHIIDNRINAETFVDQRPPPEIRPERRATERPDGTRIIQEFGPGRLGTLPF